MKCFPYFWSEQCIINPTFRFIYILLRGDYIKIAGEYYRHTPIEQGLGMLRKTFKPAKLIIKLWPWCRVAIGQSEQRNGGSALQPST